MARVKLVDKGTDYAIVKLIGLDGKNKRTVTWTVDGESYGDPIDIDSSALESPECYIDGLEPDTTYRIGAYIVYNKGQSHMSLFLSPDLTTLPEKIYVSAWSWSSSNGTASASRTKAAYNALINNGSTSDFSYLVWNDMCSKVIEIENAAGLTWSTKYASYADTKMSSSDKVLTATRFNSLRYNIGRSYSTGIDTVYPGDTVYAWYFTTLARCMNEWIDQI